MGRTRTKSKKSGNARPASPLTSNVQNSPLSAQSAAPTPASLLLKAAELITQCDWELAERFVRRALHSTSSQNDNPERARINAEAREMLGVVLIESGDVDGAREAFQSLLPPSATAIDPAPPSAHLYLAQLCDEDPHAALSHYQRAIDIFSAQLQAKGKERETEPVPEEQEIKGSIVRAIVAMVEIWMDPSYDLCFEPTAEKTCEDLLAQALQIDPGNAEALQALASVRMSQERPDDAKTCLEQVWDTWKNLDQDDPALPPIPTRLALVRLFLELSLFAPALLVLEGIMASDDQEVEAWYLEGWCFFLMGKSAKEDSSDGTLDGLGWEELGGDARECLETCALLHTNQDHPDTPLLEHVRELIGQLDALGIAAPPIVEQDEEGEWEDSDEDDDVEMS